MNIEYLIGFDFGHGETTATYIPLVGDNAGQRNNLFIRRGTQSEQCKIPSMIYKYGTKNEDGEIEFTYSLTQYLYWSPCLAFKDKISILESEENQERLKAFRAFIKAVYEKVLKNNDFLELPTEEHPYGNFLVYIACPTRWDDAEKREYKEFFEEAMGHPIEWVINESDAAFFTHRQGGLVLVVDFGSSTIDYTLMHNHKKINIDRTSCNLGARQVEQLMLADYKRHSQGMGPYKECQKISERILDRWMNIDDYLLFRLRKDKEISYSEEGQFATLRYALDYDVTRKNNNNIYAHNFPDLDALQQAEVNAGCNDGYIPRVEENFRELRGVIEKELAQRGLNIRDLKIILSGGATMMPWIRTSLMKVFDIPEDQRQTRILRDNDPSYVVANGVAKYAFAKIKIVDTIFSYLDQQIDYKAEFIRIYTDALLECQIEELKRLRDHYIRYSNTYEDLLPLLRQMNSSLTRREDFFRMVTERFNTMLNASLNEKLHDAFQDNFGVDMNIPLSLEIPPIEVGVDNSYLDNLVQRICDNQHFFGATMDKPRTPTERATVMDDLIEWERNNKFIWNPGDEFLENLREFVLFSIRETLENRDLFEVVR